MLFNKTRDYKGRAIDHLEAPVMNTPEITGSAGSVTAEYVATYRSLVGETIPSAAVTIDSAPDTLNSSNYLILTVNSVDPNAVAVRYYRKTGSNYVLLREQTSLGGANGKYAAVEDRGEELQDDVLVPSINSSGRPEWRAMLWNFDRYVQRPELQDMQTMLQNQQRKVADLTHKNGDITRNGTGRYVSANVWTYDDLDMYIDGQICTVPAGTVTLTGSGQEKVGVICIPTIVTSNDDPALWNLDTPGDLSDVNRGADRLVYSFQWVVDQPGMFVVETFLNGIPKQANMVPERTMLEKTLADREYDVTGNYVIWPFETEILDHPNDPAKAVIRVKRGKASINGYRFQHDGAQDLEFDRARDTAFQNDGSTSAFSHTGGSTITAGEGPYNVDGLKLLLQIGVGADHTVTLSGSGQSAAQVATQINNALNTIPTDPAYPLITCTALVNNTFQLKAQDGKNLTIKSIEGSAYSVLGLTPGVFTPTGTRLYRVNRQYVKDVADISYLTDTVLAISHNTLTHRDFLINNVNKIYGASITAADANDGKFDYQEGIHWFQDTADTNYINFTGMTPPEPTSTYYVKVRYRRSANKSSLVLAEAVAQIEKGALGGADYLSLTGATVTRVSNQQAITGLTGNAANIVSLEWVNSSIDADGVDYSGYSLLKNSTQLAHNAGQIQWDGVQETQPVAEDDYYCKFRFWHVATPGDVVTSDSYDTYSAIESYGTYNLRDSLDFRTTGVLPRHGEDPVYEYNYYLARVDKLLISDTEGFMIMRGSPASDPPIPNDPANMLALKVIQIPPYTYTSSDITAVDIAPVRKTQMALDRLAKQVEELQYREVIKNWEQEVAAEEGTGAVAGIFTDALTGFGKLDLQFNKHGVYHTAALDRTNRQLRLPVDQDIKQIEIDESEGSGTYNVRRIGNSLVLDYEPVVFDSQPYATRSINAAVDFTYEAYNGLVQLTPSVDIFMDTEQLPMLNADFDNNIEPLLRAANATLANQISWGSWQITGYRNWWWGGAADIARQGTYQQLMPGRSTVELGDRVVDLSLVGMMRTMDVDGNPFTIQVDCRGLMPNQDHAVSISNIVCDFTYDSAAATPKGSQGQNAYQAKTTVRTDNTGRLTGKFQMPAGVAAGTAIVRVFHHSAPTSSWANTTFSSAGLMQTNQNTTLGMAAPELYTETTTQTSWYWTWLDPLAQTFMIKDEITYMSEVGLFFRKKSLTHPISFQVRDVTNGYPNSNILATGTLEPEQITTSETTLVETRLELNQLLGYKPNVEYAIVPVPGKNNTDYELWGAKVGEIDIATGAMVGTPPHDGMLFKSPNARAWIPIEQTYLKFNLYKCNFANTAQIVFSQIDNISASMLVTAVQEFAGPGTSVKWFYSLNNKATWIPYNPMIETDLNTMATVLDIMVSIGSLGGSYTLIEKIAGIVFLKHKASAISIFGNEYFVDDLNPPNKIIALIEAEIDSERAISAKATVDDGENWFELRPTPGYTPISMADSTMYRYKYETPDATTISAASNASPIVISLTEEHIWTNGMVGVVTGIEGNTAANGTWRLQNITGTTAELYDPITGDPSEGNGAYTTGGSISFDDFDQLRPRTDLETTNLVRTPKIGKVGYIVRAD